MRYLIQPTLILMIIVGLFNTIACGEGQKTNDSPNPGAQDSTKRGKNDRQRSQDVGKNQDPPTDQDRQNLNPGESNSDSESIFELPKDPSVRGSFNVQTYTQGLQSAAYQSAMVFYPTGVNENKKLPVTTLSGGYSNTKETMTWVGEHLASHGMIVIAFTPTNNFTTDPSFWARGHTGAFKKIQEEGARSASPIKGMVDPRRIGIMGFSMGGAGTILAVDELKGEAAAAIALCPYQPKVPGAKTPILYITGTNDTTARPGPVIDAFERTQTGAPKALENIQGLGHGDIVRTNTFRKQLARSITSWMGLYVGKNENFRQFLDGSNLKFQP